jgi:hypothetical protein
VTELRHRQSLGVLIVTAAVLAAALTLFFGRDARFAGAQACSTTGPSGPSGATGPSGCYPLVLPGVQPGGTSERALPPLDRQAGGSGSQVPIGIASVAAVAVLLQVGVIARRRRRSSPRTPRI